MRALLLLAGALLGGCAGEAPAIEARDAWVRAGAQGAAAYVTLVNRGGADRLVAVASPFPASLHGTSMDGGVMRMRSLSDGLAIPAGETVALKPMGSHVMIAGRVSGPVPLTLTFARHPPITITAEPRR